MKKLIAPVRINLNVDSSVFINNRENLIDTAVKHTADFIERLNSELESRGFAANSVENGSAPAIARETKRGPLAAKWCEIKGVSRIRRMEGRTEEEQAAHNLMEHAGWSAQQVEELASTQVSNEEFPEPTEGAVQADKEGNDEREVSEADLI